MQHCFGSTRRYHSTLCGFYMIIIIIIIMIINIITTIIIVSITIIVIIIFIIIIVILYLACNLISIFGIYMILNVGVIMLQPLRL